MTAHGHTGTSHQNVFTEDHDVGGSKPPSPRISRRQVVLSATPHVLHAVKGSPRQLGSTGSRSNASGLSAVATGRRRGLRSTSDAGSSWLGGEKSQDEHGGRQEKRDRRHGEAVGVADAEVADRGSDEVGDETGGCGDAERREPQPRMPAAPATSRPARTGKYRSSTPTAVRTCSSFWIFFMAEPATVTASTTVTITRAMNIVGQLLMAGAAWR